jgi:glycerol-3-phosphate dehydrogenase
VTALDWDPAWQARALAGLDQPGDLVSVLPWEGATLVGTTHLTTPAT